MGSCSLLCFGSSSLRRFCVSFSVGTGWSDQCWVCWFVLSSVQQTHFYPYTLCPLRWVTGNPQSEDDVTNVSNCVSSHTVTSPSTLMLCYLSALMWPTGSKCCVAWIECTQYEISQPEVAGIAGKFLTSIQWLYFEACAHLPNQLPSLNCYVRTTIAKNHLL